MAFGGREDSGHLWLEDDLLCYASDTYGQWRLPVTELRIFGESTDQNGPFADDYWLCFVTEPPRWHEASFYADGRDQFLKQLGDRLGFELRLTLCNSTDFRSNILWPAHLAGRALFKHETRFVAGFWRRLLIPIFGAHEDVQTLADDVLEALRHGTSSHPVATSGAHFQ